MQFESFIKEKRYDKDGNYQDWGSNRYSAADLLTTKYLKRELDDKIGNMIQRAKHEVEVDIVKSLEQKLKENLAKDTMEKMNIPEVLKKLQSGTLGMIEEKGQ